jgi:glycine oxidase
MPAKGTMALTSPRPRVSAIAFFRRNVGERLDIAIVGAGVIGLSVGWRLVREGRGVTVYDRGAAGRATSWVAGGMLAPVSEYGFEDEDFFQLGAASLERYPGFLEELSSDAGERVELDTRGTLSVGLDRDDTEALRRVYRFREHRDLPVRWLTGTEAREIEPLLSPKVASGMWIPDDHQIDNHKLVRALATAFVARGGTLREHCEVRAIRCDGDRAAGVELEGGAVDARVVVLAAGPWSGRIEGIPESARPPVRPVKGQIVALREADGFHLEHVVRTPDCYLVSKGDGRLLVGASEEDMGFDTTPTAGAVMRLVERAWEAVPGIYDLPIDSIDVGLRPGSRDHLPIIGETRVKGLYMATGHYRHGILLAPATADAMCDAIVRGQVAASTRAFSPERFVRA